MASYELIRYLTEKLKHSEKGEIENQIDGIPYKIKVIPEDEKNNIHIPSILMIPLTKSVNNQLALETNNLETDNFNMIIEQGMYTSVRLATLTTNLPCPILVPLIPSYKDYPYLQQLSKECFELTREDKNYRIDEQIVRLMDKIKTFLETEQGITIKDKIFLNGYSSSGCFAQRFSLLHPEIVEVACIGGSSGSIPIPTKKLGYPLGIADFEILTGKKFNLESYSKIKFRYYVGELEAKNKTNSRFDDFGLPAPMHDMSYFDRSVPTEVGKQQREYLGIDMFSRSANTIKLLQSLGIDIKHHIILGRGHNNINCIGVNELSDKFINDTYKEAINRNKKGNDSPKR